MNAGGALDGSAADAMRCLRELAALAGQEGDVPVLELQLGGILTRTAVHAGGGGWLVITAQATGDGPAPAPDAPAPDAPPTDAMETGERGELEMLWDADQGGLMAVRRVALRDLPDEHSLMDAILVTADLAAARLCGREGAGPA